MQSHPDEPLVSVVMPIFNRTTFIDQSIGCILSQDYPWIEVIIVDDGSSQDIQTVINKKFNNNKIKFYTKAHTGLSDTLNFGIGLAQGQFIAFLDDDDIWSQQMISKAVAAIKNKNVDVIHVGYNYFRENNSQIKTLNTHLPMMVDNPMLLKIFSQKNIFPVNSVLIKKDILEKVGCFNKSMETNMDWDLWFKVIALGVKVDFVNACLAHIRIHENNMSRDEVRMRQGALQVLENAREYLNPSQKRIIDIEGKIAYRLIVLGWYLCLKNRIMEGRKRILSVQIGNALWWLVSRCMYALTFLPFSLLRKINFLLEKALLPQSYHI